MKRTLSKEWCEAKYYYYHDKLEDLLTITFIGMFIIFFFIIILGGSIKEALIYTGIAYGFPFAIVRVIGITLRYSLSIFDWIFRILTIIFTVALGDIITLFAFIHYACQTFYYYRNLKN